MAWECVNPAEIAARLPQDNPVASRGAASAAVAGKLTGAFRDGLHWGDERLWRRVGDDRSRPFNLSPLLPNDFEIGCPHEMMAESETLLRDGQWERGWQLYEMRHQIEQGQRQMPRLFMPHWDGRSQCRRLLVHAAQGAGDAIMFARYLTELDRRGIASDFLVPPNLVRLMQKLPYRGEIVHWLDEHLYDAHIPVESLPLALKMFEPFDAGRYLRSQRVMFHVWGAIAGVVWAGQSFHPRNAHRTMTLEQILAHVPQGMSAVSLQVGDAREQLRFAPGIEDRANRLRDWSDTAYALAGVDLLVTVDTGIAHLAGAMGIRVKLILREPAEWRWGRGSETPWYDSVQIVRLDANSSSRHHSELLQAGAVVPVS